MKPKKTAEIPLLRVTEPMKTDLESLAIMARRNLPDYLRILYEDHIAANKQKLEEYRRG